MGCAQFDGAAGFEDTDVWSGKIKYALNPASTTARVFANGGLGLYHFDPGDAEFGFNIGAGVKFPIGRRFALEGTYNYHYALTASPNHRYSQLQAGLNIYF